MGVFESPDRRVFGDTGKHSTGQETASCGQMHPEKAQSQCQTGSGLKYLSNSW